MRSILGAQETEDTCREGGTPSLPEMGRTALPLPDASRHSTWTRCLATMNPVSPGDDIARAVTGRPSLERSKEQCRGSPWRIPQCRVGAGSITLAGWPVAGPRTLLWCCKLMSENALHPFTHHSRFVQLSGLLPKDFAAQEHELLCRATEFCLTFDQLQSAELSCMELSVRRLLMLEMKHRDKVAGSLLGGFNRGGQPHSSWHPGHSHDRARARGVALQVCEGDSRCERTSKTS